MGWWAVTHDGRAIRYREMYGVMKDPETGRPKHNVGVEKSSKDLAEESFRISVPEGCKDCVADPSIWSQIDERPSIADTFEAAGWNMVKADNDRISGLARVHDYMKGIAADGRPLLLVFSTCADWIRTIPLLIVDEKNQEDIDTDGEDHAYDDTRYFLMSGYTLPKRRELVNVGRAYERQDDREYNPLDWEMK
jgi:hypothetical protein